MDHLQKNFKACPVPSINQSSNCFILFQVLVYNACLLDYNRKRGVRKLSMQTASYLALLNFSTHYLPFFPFETSIR